MPGEAESGGEEHEFRYQTVRGARILYAGLYLFGLIVVPVGLVRGFREAYPADRVLTGFLVVVGIVFLRAMYYAAIMVFEVTLRGRTVTLRSLTRRTALSVDDIRMFTHPAFNYSILDLRSARGVFHLVTPLDQLHDLIARVRSMNSQIVTRGI